MIKDFITNTIIAAVLLAVIIISTTNPKPPSHILININYKNPNYIVVAREEDLMPNCMEIEGHDVL